MSKSSRPLFRIAEVVPHSGTMSLLDEVVDYGADWIQAKLVITPRSLFANPKGVPSWIGIEYMAQTVAAYAGVRRRLQDQQAVIGFLVGIRQYHCNCAHFAIGSELLISANLDFESDNGLGSFQCTIRSEGIAADASVNVFQPDDADEFLKNEI